MRGPPLLRKELAWGRRKLLPILFVFLLLPGTFAYATLAFDTVLPTDAPVAIVPQDEDVTDDELTVASGAATLFSEPVTYESRSAAFGALERERVYAIVTVPHGIQNASTEAVFHLYVDGSIVPYHQASKAVVSVMNFYLRETLSSPISVERHVVGAERALSEYLIPTFLMALVMLVALAYLPYVLASERVVIDRLRMTTSLEAVVGWKIAFFTGLVVVPVGVFQVAGGNFGYDLSLASVGAVAVYALTFVYLAAIGAAVTLLTRFATWGRLLNVLLLFALFTFSGLLYPAGFFSSARRELVRAVPTHYSMVAVRGYALRDAPLDYYADWFAGLLAVTVASLVVLKVAIVQYERGH